MTDDVQHRSEGIDQTQSVPSSVQDARPIVLVNDTRPDNHFGCTAVMDALTVLLNKSGFQITHFHPVGRPWMEDAAFLAAASKASAIVVNGEGSLHHANARALNLSLIGPFCRQTLRIPGILVNATLEANDARVYENLRHYSLISVRDRESATEPMSFGIPEPIYCPDFSMFHDFRSSRSAEPAVPPLVIGHTDSVLKAVTMKIQAAASKYGMVARPIVHKQPPPRRSIYNYARSVAELDLLVTGRYHAVCYAIATGTPFVAMESNTTKISRLLRDVFGDTRRVINPGVLESSDLASFAGWTPAEAESLARFAAFREHAYADLGRRIQAACTLHEGSAAGKRGFADLAASAP